LHLQEKKYGFPRTNSPKFFYTFPTSVLYYVRVNDPGGGRPMDAQARSLGPSSAGIKHSEIEETLMLELQNLCFQVSGEADGQTQKGESREIIRDISLTFEDHTFIAITGPNGGGKSTLAKLIMGMEQPTSGRILYNGTDITQMSITERANLGISFAFQQPVRFKGIKVRDLIALASGTASPTGQAVHRDKNTAAVKLPDVCDYLSKVGLCARDYINREVDASLSGGELKRIEIATIIARNTPLSVFDEPEAGIDLWSFNNLIQVFEDMHRESGNSLILISHQERILNIADEIIVLADGCVKARGRREEILPELLQGTESCKFYAAAKS